MSQTLWVIIAVWFTGVNLMAMILWSHDKSRAVRGSRRISEKTLLLLAMLGAWPASLLMAQWVRHKRRKDTFMARLHLIAGLQSLGIVLIWLYAATH
ncbi:MULTISPECIES: DUF1294 domain-containing protein [Asticcacaulis]|uniref:DUF1294 domain-containing protein n=1 Tax=Asticcacaulis TaxID=76890 RepID=UPI001AEB851F|nr:MULTISPECIES: DUF1294 domain-containing protein [Asticcacaulis]MBP2161575.1 uncharacterized membrane protein YsdA (DUF1294 family) [Asticcacaulis solisilvae]MDR6802574.1 uncharacterized membrane protein YsdA (DUF1294 family) [Asticcacaulis sp. BE141]